MQTEAIEFDAKLLKQHAAGGHLVDQRVEPVDKQQFQVRCLTLDGDLLPTGDHVRVGDDRRECKGRGLEGHGGTATPSTYTDVCLVVKMFPHVSAGAA